MVEWKEKTLVDEKVGMMAGMLVAYLVVWMVDTMVV